MAHRPFWLLALCSCLALIPSIALAGTLCGTVTDRTTSAPIAHAGIFLRTTAGAYTGLHGATDAAGAFCIGSVPNGTYDLEVRVDDYQVAYLRGVTVTGTTDVEVGASRAIQLAAPSPNPCTDRTRLRWTLATPSGVELSIVDVRGRFVRGWSASALSPGEHSIDWDLSDAHGRPVDPGLYFVRLRAGDIHLIRSFVRVR